MAWAANPGGTEQTIGSSAYVGSYQGVSGPAAGGYVDTARMSTDNTLNVFTSGLMAMDMQGFQYANFALFSGGDTRQQWDSNGRDALGNTANYDKNTTYYGIHAGLGYLWDLSEKLELDLYAKYFWSHQTGFDVELVRATFTFDAENSHRVRAGGRLSYAVSF